MSLRHLIDIQAISRSYASIFDLVIGTDREHTFNPARPRGAGKKVRYSEYGSTALSSYAFFSSTDEGEKSAFSDGELSRTFTMTA
jgi:hypothetical protein